MLPPAVDRRHDSILSGVLILLAAFVVFAGIRVRDQYRQGVDLAVLKTRVDALRRDFQVQVDASKTKFDEVDQTLYPNAEAIKSLKAPPRRPSSIEVWEINRDKELRTRITDLQQRQNEYDRKLAEIQRLVEKLQK